MNLGGGRFMGNQVWVLRGLAALLILTALLTSATAREDRPIGGLIYGHVYGYDMDGRLIPLSWAKITVMREGEVVVVGYSSDGYYEVITPGGDLTITVEHPGYVNQTLDVYVSPSSATALNFNLERSGEPIPEYPAEAYPLIITLTLAGLLMLMKKKGMRGTRRNQTRSDEQSKSTRPQ
jgi:hypothetical protein